MDGPLNMGTGNATLDALAFASGAAPTSLVIEWAILVGVALLMTILRTIARARISGWKGLKWDDGLVWAAFVAYVGLTINVYIISVSSEGLANDSLSEERREALARDGENSQEVQLRQMGSKAQLAKWIVYSLVLWLLKASLLHFFAVRLTDGMRGAKLRAWISAGILFLTWSATVVSVFVTCRPFKMMWQIFPDPGIICLPAISPVLISVFLSCNIFTDIYLISLPIPVLIRAPLKKTQKLSLISLFSCNILITGIALTRAILMLKDPKHNSNGMWAVRETFVALITTNLPPIAPLIRQLMSPCLGRMQDTTSDTTTNDTTDDSLSRKNTFSRRPSTAAGRMSRKPSRAGHNETMKNRYLSGFGGPDEGGNEIKMQTYNISPKDGGRRSIDDEWKAFRGLTAPSTNYEPFQQGAPSPGFIIQKHHDDPPAYRESDGNVAHEPRYIV